MHPLLTRQLKRLFGISDEPKLAAALLELRQLANSDGLQEESRNLLEGLDRLLGQIDNTYQQHEADITLRDQSLEISNEEILQANEKLRRKERRQHAIIESLRRTANELLRSTHLPELSDDETSLEKLSLLMSDLVKERQQVQSKLERTLSELERQKSAIDQHAIVSITDTNGKVTYANEGFCRVSGYQRYELIGKKHPQFNQTDRSAAIIKKIWSTIRHGHTWKGEFANRNKTGTLYWLDATIVPFLDNQGEPSQYISICTDITERRIFQACRDAQDAKRDVQVPLLPSLITTVISFCRSRPASGSLRQSIASSDQTSYPYLKWLNGVSDAYAASPLAQGTTGMLRAAYAYCGLPAFVSLSMAGSAGAAQGRYSSSRIRQSGKERISCQYEP